MYRNVFIPYKGYYSTPFCRWQGSMANENAIDFGAATANRWLAKKGWDPDMFDYSIFGNTIGQHRQFYASSWAPAAMGAGKIPGLAISQACTTGTTCINLAALGIENGLYELPFVLTADRTSNGPHTIWPNPMGPGGEVISENWNMDNFACDPNTGTAQVEAGEIVAKAAGFTREQCDELVLNRYRQYLMSLENDREFQKRYMFPAEVHISRKKTVLVETDEGVTPCTEEGLARLKPAKPGGVLTHGAQTHPADGNAAIVVTTRDKAKELSEDPKISIQVVSYGFSRVQKSHMPMAPVPAAKHALKNAGVAIQDIRTIKTHNPFIINDLYFVQQFGIDPAERFNNYGSSLIFGHPQGPTATRLIMEGIEETVLRGGGYFMWAGCGAGDCGASMIFKIG